MQMSPEHLSLVSGVFQRSARGQWNLYQMKSGRAVGWTHIPQEVNSLGEHIVSPINVVKYQLIMDETDELIKLRDYIEMDIANSRAEKIVGKECLLTELHLRHEEHERRMWQEKMDAELEATHKWLELEKEACSTTAKLPKLLITPLKGTSTNWVRFGNMFVTKVQNKSISTEEKFGYLLEMVNPKVRAKIHM